MLPIRSVVILFSAAAAAAADIDDVRAGGHLSYLADWIHLKKSLGISMTD
jgi:hypothetical protein